MYLSFYLAIYRFVRRGFVGGDGSARGPSRYYSVLQCHQPRCYITATSFSLSLLCFYRYDLIYVLRAGPEPGLERLQRRHEIGEFFLLAWTAFLK
jgi:hypothetical protein